jgi:hypothetical protein
MAGDLYWDDTLAWSEQQAALLRRVASGERVNDVDWAHVIEEIEDVGKSEQRACESLLVKAFEHLLKIRGWPSCEAVPHWRGEVLGLLRGAARAFSPSMRQKIDLASLYEEARDIVAEDRIDGAPAGPLPPACPFTLDALLAKRPDLDALLAKLKGGSSG